MLGLGQIEKLNQIFTALRMAKGITDEEAERRLGEVLEKLPKETGALYQRFVGTLMASGSEEGTKRLMYPPPDAKPASSAEMLYSRRSRGHFSHPWEIQVEGRKSMVCNGRRLFVGEAAGLPKNNFGLCPGNTQEGYFVALFLGSDLLHIIRQVGGLERQPAFRLVGEAYVHSWMDGQLAEGLRVLELPELLKASVIRLK
ncbi:hypothetical protein VTI74DRAFT_6661 [Chaetomium olivicolor]